MLRVILESPFAGDVPRNKIYLCRCIRDCLARDETPYASHSLLTDALDDLKPEERKRGIDAAREWRDVAHLVVVYTDYGISAGMQHGIDAWEKMAKGLRKSPVQYRTIGPNP